MEVGGKLFLVCDCEGTMPIDGKALAKACGAQGAAVARQLCRAQIEEFQRLAAQGTPLVVACTQEAPLFLETLGEMDNPPEVRFTNIRERAGWSAEAEKAMPKMAALLAEAALEMQPTPAVSMTSKGVVLVIGHDETAIEAAKQLAPRMDVTVLLASGGKALSDVIPPSVMDVPVFSAIVNGAKGHLGAFEVGLGGAAAAVPSSRDVLRFQPAGGEGVSECDLILDLRGGPPLFAAPEKRDGYLNPDPGNPALVQRALFRLLDLVGEFDKPRYVDFEAALCAHARNGRVGCNRCLDVCPAGAIAPAGDVVVIDPFVCAGCGGCASVCPTGAATYALPAGDGVQRRLRALLGVYAQAGGEDPVLLVHDTDHGEPMIDMAARHGRGLPANVLPFAVNAVTQVGLDFLLAAASLGASRTLLLVTPARGEETAPLAGQAALADDILAGLGYGKGRIAIVEEADPAAFEERLYGLAPIAPMPRGDFTPMGKKRSLMSLALHRLHKNAAHAPEVIALPAGAPFGSIEVDVAGCTLCLACVGVCPTGAIKDNPERPQLRFQEDACVQCGLCTVTCPEKVIALAPRLSFAREAQDYRILKEEEPFHCVRCGKPFGVRSSIERMVGKLAGHSMFAGTDRLDLIRMCDNCRVIVQMERQDHPLAGPPRPKTRTTEDYLRERDELRQVAAEAARKGGGSDDG